MMVYAILALVLALVIAVSWTILRLGESPPKFLDGSLEVEFSPPDSSIARVFSQEDINYLFGCDQATREMIHRFRRTRRRVAGLFLSGMRRDFYRGWSLCRHLAPLSEDPDFAAKLFQQFVIFHFLYMRVSLRSLVGDFGIVEVETLADLLGQLRETTGQLVRMAQAAAAGA